MRNDKIKSLTEDEIDYIIEHSDFYKDLLSDFIEFYGVEDAKELAALVNKRREQKE